MIGSRFRKLWRVVWIPVVTAVLAGLLAVGVITTTGQSDVSYRSQLLVLVPATPPPTPPIESESPESTSTTAFDPLGRPTEALRAASNYAEVIPQDEAVRQSVAAAALMDPQDVIGRIEASAVPDSSLIVITFDADSAEASEAGIQAIEEAIIGDQPATPAISPRSLIVVSSESAEEVGGGGASLIASAVLLGAVFGAFVAVLWTRTNARVDGVDDVSALGPWPVFDMAADDHAALEALRTSLLPAGGSDPAGGTAAVAVVAADERATDGALYAVGVLRAVPDGGPTVSFSGISGSPRAPGAGAEVLRVVIAVSLGGRVSALVDALEDAGRSDTVVAGVLIVAPGSAPAPPVAAEQGSA